MIREKDVVTLRMPYPNVSSNLAVLSHMYICKKPGKIKKLLKIQTIKNRHKTKGYPCLNFYELKAVDQNNPCNRDSFVDLDKNFILEHVNIPLKLKTKKELHKESFLEILERIRTIEDVNINTKEFLSINILCS